MTTAKKAPDLGEAPASITFKGITKGGWDVQFTIRDTDEYVLLNRFGDFVKRLDEFQVTPKPVPVAHDTPAQAPLPPAQPVLVPEEQGTQVFEADMLIGSTSGDKTYWKVQGGQFSKYGVTIWPEVLEAAGIGDLDPAQTYDLTGYTAYYVLKDTGKPDKVVNLSK